MRDLRSELAEDGRCSRGVSGALSAGFAQESLSAASLALFLGSADVAEGLHRPHVSLY